MNISLLLRNVGQSLCFIAPRMVSMEPLTSMKNRAMHHMCNRQYLPDLSLMKQTSSPVLLQPSLPIYSVLSGMKMKTVLHRRCRDCLVIWINDRKYIKCKKHPRHNQVERKKAPYNTWILTSISQKPVRDW